MTEPWEWQEITPNKFRRQIGNQIETRETYFAKNCINFGYNSPVEVSEYSLISPNQFSAYTYSIRALDGSHNFAHSGHSAIYEEHEKLESVECIRLHELLYG